MVARWRSPRCWAGGGHWLGQGGPSARAGPLRPRPLCFPGATRGALAAQESGRNEALRFHGLARTGVLDHPEQLSFSVLASSAVSTNASPTVSRQATVGTRRVRMWPAQSCPPHSRESLDKYAGDRLAADGRLGQAYRQESRRCRPESRTTCLRRPTMHFADTSPNPARAPLKRGRPGYQRSSRAGMMRVDGGSPCR